MENFSEEELVEIIGDSTNNTKRAEVELSRRQILETRELNKQMKVFSESSDRFSRILFLVACLQLLVAIFQLFVPLFLQKKDVWKGVVVEILLFSFGAYLFYGSEFFPKKNKK